MLQRMHNLYIPQKASQKIFTMLANTVNCYVHRENLVNNTFLFKKAILKFSKKANLKLILVCRWSVLFKQN